MNHNKKLFSTNDLRKCNWQYQITHTTTDEFDMCDIVFLKSNPESPLLVTNVNEHTIECNIVFSWEINVHEFSPEALLHYKHAGLLTYNEKYNISLN